MADHAKPVTTDTYANVLAYIDARLDDLTVALDPARVTPTNLPSFATRWSSASKKWQVWNGSAWGDLSADYAINITGTVNKVTVTAPATAATLTLANGSTFRTIGAYTAAFTFTAATALTFPTTGTLATRAGAETFTNKTYTSPVITGTITTDYATGYAATLGDDPEDAVRFGDLGSAAYADLVTLVKTSTPRTITTATAALQNSDTWAVINYAGTCTLTLGSAVNNPGKCCTIKTITANTVVSAASDVVPLVGGAAGTAILSATAGKWARLVSDGVNWIIMEAA